MNSFFQKILSLYRILLPSTHAKRVKVWRLANGDKTLRLNYDDLDSNSIVFDIGGYEGQWASDIFAKYGASIYIFEPVEKYFKLIKNRFSKNTKIHIHHFGLGAVNKYETLSILGDQSSIFKRTKNNELHEKIEIQDISQLMVNLGITKIDLMKINIEGGEYDLLEQLINSGGILQVVNIQVQFHDFVADAEKRMKNIQDLLAKTHESTYKYNFVWENWRIKNQKHIQ